MRKHMQKRLMRLWDTWLLRKCTRMETGNDPLKNSSPMAHTRHRSVTGIMLNLVAGLIAYRHHPKKPALGRRRDPLVPMLVM